MLNRPRCHFHSADGCRNGVHLIKVWPELCGGKDWIWIMNGRSIALNKWSAASSRGRNTLGFRVVRFYPSFLLLLLPTNVVDFYSGPSLPFFNQIINNFTSSCPQPHIGEYQGNVLLYQPLALFPFSPSSHSLPSNYCYEKKLVLLSLFVFLLGLEGNNTPSFEVTAFIYLLIF